MTKTLSLLGAAAAALCLSSAAFAQDQSAPPAAAAAPHGADRTMKMEAWRKAHEERRAHRLHDLLQIRSDQETAFQAFLADIKPPMHDHKDWARDKDAAAVAAPLTTPERLDRMEAMMAKRTAERQAAFQHRAEAIKKFYAVLSPEQKRAFDALHDRGGMGHGGEDHGPRGMGDRDGSGDQGGREHGWEG
jgi:Spy/CpxP family protein refolding chaperone